MLVKTQGLFVLLIDIDFTDVHFFDGMLKKCFADPLSAIIWVNEQHLAIALSHPQESNNSLLVIANTPQVDRIQVLVEDKGFEKLNVSSDVELTHLALRHKLIDSDQL